MSSNNQSDLYIFDFDDQAKTIVQGIEYALLVLLIISTIFNFQIWYRIRTTRLSRGSMVDAAAARRDSFETVFITHGISGITMGISIAVILQYIENPSHALVVLVTFFVSATFSICFHADIMLISLMKGIISMERKKDLIKDTFMRRASLFPPYSLTALTTILAASKLITNLSTLVRTYFLGSSATLVVMVIWSFIYIMKCQEIIAEQDSMESNGSTQSNLVRGLNKIIMLSKGLIVVCFGALAIILGFNASPNVFEMQYVFIGYLLYLQALSVTWYFAICFLFSKPERKSSTTRKSKVLDGSPVSNPVEASQLSTSVSNTNSMHTATANSQNPPPV